jgi:hypothetical protein
MVPLSRYFCHSCAAHAASKLVTTNFAGGGSDDLSILIRSLCVSLTSPATLESLRIDIWFPYPDDYDAFFENLRDADVWSQLDSIITYPTGSRLQRVYIYIQGIGYAEADEQLEPDELDEIFQAVKDSLPLLCEKGILFVEVAKPNFG